MSGANSREVTKAVILARGLGTRMRRDDPAAPLSPDQAAAAGAGMKGMVPVAGRPFLDYVLSALADAGFREACLVIGPEHGAVRDHYTRGGEARRVRVAFAVQERPLGTADAVLAAEAFAGGEPFLVINADNYYPPAVLAALRDRGAPALAGFDAEALGRGGNIPPERIASFAVVDVAPDGSLRRIVEKPGPDALRAFGGTRYVSMTCWLFTPDIFDACRGVAPSPRGELELPQAVQDLVDGRGARFAVVPVRAPVLDLSRRADIPAVAERLRDVVVRL